MPLLSYIKITAEFANLVNQATVLPDAYRKKVTQAGLAQRARQSAAARL